MFIPFGVGTNSPAAFTTEWQTTTANETITLPLYNSGTFSCTVDWGDTTTSTVSAYNDTRRIHTYAASGTHQVAIWGECPAWSFNNTGDKLKIKRIINWGNKYGFGGFRYLTNGFYGCSNLTSLGSGKIVPKSTLLTSMSYAFANTNITAIPAGIFDNCVDVTTFYGTFKGCNHNASIPTDLFRYNTAVSQFAFNETFISNAITSIPTDLFRYNTGATDYAFQSTFGACSSLTSIPTDLFRYNTLVSSGAFASTFMYTAITSIPTDLFRYNTAVVSAGINGGFASTFTGCASLTSIPTDLFRYNTLVSTSAFDSTFYGCSALTSAPTGLFKYNTAVSTNGFRYTFRDCVKLKLNAYIFYGPGESATRFHDVTTSFERCFNLGSTFSGVQGTAPDIWNCDFGTGTITKTLCFNGQSNLSLTNWYDIPLAWQ